MTSADISVIGYVLEDEDIDDDEDDDFDDDEDGDAEDDDEEEDDEDVETWQVSQADGCPKVQPFS